MSTWMNYGTAAFGKHMCFYRNVKTHEQVNNGCNFWDMLWKQINMLGEDFQAIAENLGQLFKKVCQE